MPPTIQQGPFRQLGIGSHGFTKLDTYLKGPFAMHWDALTLTWFQCRPKENACVGCQSTEETDRRTFERYCFRGIDDETETEAVYNVGRTYQTMHLIPQPSWYRVEVTQNTTPRVLERREVWDRPRPTLSVEDALVASIEHVRQAHDAGIKIGDRFKDNDPRVVRDGGVPRTFTVTSIYDGVMGTKKVQVLDDLGRFTVIRYDRLATDRSQTGYTPILKEN